MLDFGRLIEQIQLVGRESFDQRVPLAELMARAEKAYTTACENGGKFEQRLKANATTVLWPLAVPLEPLAEAIKLPEPEDNITVMAVDGSQIMPSQHEIHSCFLLNIGFVQLAYGTKSPPVLESFPHLYHKKEELYPLVDRRRLHIDELYVSLERNLLEFEYLIKRISQAKEIGQPVLAMLDGSLIPWSSERMPESYQKRYLERWSTIMRVFQEEQVPIVGYISHSRSSELINDLRVSTCPYEESRCKEHCGDLNEEEFPCSAIWPVSDRTMLGRILPDDYRTVAFLSGASVSRSFPEDMRFCFLYLNLKDEIARIEFPRWILSDKQRFDTALGAVLSQVRKGMGYPVALAEAHHLAVIKGNDRKQFFDLLTRHLVLIGASHVAISPKEKKKRVGLV
ncbi:MAG: hypothetical protein C5B53_04050 [Candidatus Melainabacteria bacterium]|nr:MAG: hypothetical protein C5B53_04050 [Candidatus Melainabacteria bacterium]